MKKNNTIPDIIIYQTDSGAIELKGDVSHDTIWAKQGQIAEIFGIDRTVATRHINNVFRSGEVDKKSNVQKMHIANSDKPVKFYSLDIILLLMEISVVELFLFSGFYKNLSILILTVFLQKHLLLLPYLLQRAIQKKKKRGLDLSCYYGNKNTSCAYICRKL